MEFVSVQLDTIQVQASVCTVYKSINIVSGTLNQVPSWYAH